MGDVGPIQFFLVFFLNLARNSDSLGESLIVGEQELRRQPLLANEDTFYLHGVVEILIIIEHVIVGELFILVPLLLKIVVLILNVRVDIQHRFSLRSQLVVNILHLALHLLLAL